MNHTYYCLTGDGPGKKGELALSLPAPPRGTALLVYRFRRRKNDLVRRVVKPSRDMFDEFTQVKYGVNILIYRLKLQDLATNTTSKRYSKILKIKFTNEEIPKCGYKTFA